VSAVFFKLELQIQIIALRANREAALAQTEELFVFVKTLAGIIAISAHDNRVSIFVFI